jgi:hypothetical protein
MIAYGSVLGKNISRGGVHDLAEKKACPPPDIVFFREKHREFDRKVENRFARGTPTPKNWESNNS